VTLLVITYRHFLCGPPLGGRIMRYVPSICHVPPLTRQETQLSHSYAPYCWKSSCHSTLLKSRSFKITPL